MPLALIVLLDYVSSFAVKPSRNSTDIPLLVAFIFIRKYLNFAGSSSGNYCLSCLIRASFGFSFLSFAEFIIPEAISADPWISFLLSRNWDNSTLFTLNRATILFVHRYQNCTSLRGNCFLSDNLSRCVVISRWIFLTFVVNFMFSFLFFFLFK